MFPGSTDQPFDTSDKRVWSIPGSNDLLAGARLAEICAAAVTALDLNTACAQAAGYEMADSHVRLARGEKS